VQKGGGRRKVVPYRKSNEKEKRGLEGKKNSHTGNGKATHLSRKYTASGNPGKPKDFTGLVGCVKIKRRSTVNKFWGFQDSGASKAGMQKKTTMNCKREGTR